MMNNMNQFGNNLNAPYGQNDYSQFFYGKNQYGQQQQQNMNNLLLVEWERDTVNLCQTLYNELIRNNDIVSAEKVKELMCETQEELCEAEQYHLNKLATNFNMTYIIEEQEK